MRVRISALLVLVVLACPAVRGGQAPLDDESVWRAFNAWFKTAPAGNPIPGYAAALQAEGMAPEEVQRRMRVIGRLFGERSDWVETYFDKVFAGIAARPLTGDPERDHFTSSPSVWLVQAVKGVKPGAALDAGMGQGRNAVYLAGLGWTVTGFDVSAEAVKTARANAGSAGVRLEAIKAGYADFQFGAARWDLIVLTFAWAPVTDASFVARLRTSLRPGGRVVFEHFIDDPAQPRPVAMQALRPGQLRALFADFDIDRYEEVEGVGDWGGPGERLVRMVAVRK